MAKRICDPTSGKIGNQVYQNSRNGQVVRTRAIPTNPNSAQQVEARDNMKAAAQAYDALTEAQQNAWIEAAAVIQSRSRLGQSGPLTGLQYYVKVNAALLEIGSAQLSTPPSAPTFGSLVITSESLENASGVLTFAVTLSGTLPSGTRMFAAAPVNPGVRRPPDMVDLGAVPALVGQVTDVASLYSTRFGCPAIGKRVHYKFVQQVTGLYGPAEQRQALVADGG